jgi:hypothetical protein
MRRASERPHTDVQAGGIESAVAASRMATVIYYSGLDVSSCVAPQRTHTFWLFAERRNILNGKEK